MEYQHLSAQALQSQIQQTKQKEAKQKEAELKQAFSQHWKAEKIELAQEIRAMIEKGGHDVDDILDQLTQVIQD